jgi:hypothetical protein
MVLVGHVGRRLTICTVSIQDNQQDMDQSREYWNKSAHEEQNGLDKHYEHGKHRDDNVEVGDTSRWSESAIEKIRIELNIQLTPDDRRTDRSMICVGVENFSG